MNRLDSAEPHAAIPHNRGRKRRWFYSIAGLLILALVLVRTAQQRRTQNYLQKIRATGLPAT